MLLNPLNASTPLARRTLLQAGGLSALGLSLPQLSAARAAADAAPAKAMPGSRGTAKACILLYMLGGPPQQETFDLKPEAPGTARSLFRPIATNVPGMEICELLPDLARQADRFAILRSVFHAGNSLFHGAEVHYNLTGWANFPREGELAVEKWLKPSKGDFRIYYAHDDEYVPDFAVETKTVRYLCEPKSSAEMKDETVLAKARAASLWCQRVTEHAGGKPWKYLLIPHDAIDESKTLAGLAAMWEFHAE